MAKDDKVLMDRLTTVMKKKPAPKPEPKDVQSESSKMQQAEEEKQRKVDLEYENYMKGDKTRLKDQGGSMFAKGGAVKKYDKGGDVDKKDDSIMSKIKKYSPRQAEEVEESTAKTRKHGDAAVKDIKEGKYGSAALNTAKGLGSAAETLLFKAPKAAAYAGMNRLRDGEKKDLGMKKGGKVSSASSRGDGIAQRGKTKGRMV